jgi:hypothetical protein
MVLSYINHDIVAQVELPRVRVDLETDKLVHYVAGYIKYLRKL